MHYNFIYFSIYRSLYECGVEDQATVRMISLARRPEGIMVIFIKCLNGDIFMIDIDRSQTIATMKAEIQHTKGVDPAVQVLIWAGEQLLDEKTVEEYQMENHSTIYMMVRQPISEISIQALNCQTIKIRVRRKSVSTARNLLKSVSLKRIHFI